MRADQILRMVFNRILRPKLMRAARTRAAQRPDGQAPTAEDRRRVANQERGVRRLLRFTRLFR